MTQKSILITGCSSGIGLEAAKTLQQRGYLVVASCRKSTDIPALKAVGFKHVLQLDLTSSESIRAAIAETLAITDGKLFALFNNGAFGLPGAVEDLTREALKVQFETNFFGTHELTQLLLPTLLSMPDARIIQNSSVLGLVPMPARGAYIASKFALEGLTDTMRLELHNTSVKVVTIEPGPITSYFRQNALQAMTRYVDYQNSRHQAMYEQSLARLKSKESSTRFTLPASAVVDKLILALEKPRPNPRYFVTFPTHLMASLKRVLSTRALDRFIIKFGSP